VSFEFKIPSTPQNSNEVITFLPGRQGEEVTISYGDYPDEVFFLFFGFLPDPDPNPCNSMVLFAGEDAWEDTLTTLGYSAPRMAPEGLPWHLRYPPLPCTAPPVCQNTLTP